MQLLQPEDLDVVAKDNLAEDEIPTVEIIQNGKPTGRQVSGAILEAAVKTPDGYILFLSDDIPQEDMLSIHYLDEQFKPLDSVTIGSIYSTGSFAGLELKGESELQFRFIDDKIWHLYLLHGAQFAVPFVSEPKGVWRKFGFKRLFKIECSPITAEAET